MIIQERKADLIHTYSDKGVYVHGGYPEADYAVAIDPVSTGRVYTETNRRIEPDAPPENLNEAIEYLVDGRLVSVSGQEDELDYLNEREPEPEYFE